MHYAKMNGNRRQQVRSNYRHTLHYDHDNTLDDSKTTRLHFITTSVNCAINCFTTFLQINVFCKELILSLKHWIKVYSQNGTLSVI